MGVNSLPKTVTRQRRDCDLNPDPTAPESSTPTTRLASQRVWCETGTTRRLDVWSSSNFTRQMSRDNAPAITTNDSAPPPPRFKHCRYIQRGTFTTLPTSPTRISAPVPDHLRVARQPSG